jgi:hypothetical protein
MMGKIWKGLVDERAHADHSMKLLNGRGVDRLLDGRDQADQSIELLDRRELDRRTAGQERAGQGCCTTGESRLRISA